MSSEPKGTKGLPPKAPPPPPPRPILPPSREDYALRADVPHVAPQPPTSPSPRVDEDDDTRSLTGEDWMHRSLDHAATIAALRQQLANAQEGNAMLSDALAASKAVVAEWKQNAMAWGKMADEFRAARDGLAIALASLRAAEVEGVVQMLHGLGGVSKRVIVVDVPDDWPLGTPVAVRRLAEKAEPDHQP